MRPLAERLRPSPQIRLRLAGSGQHQMGVVAERDRASMTTSLRFLGWKREVQPTTKVVRGCQAAAASARAPLAGTEVPGPQGVRQDRDLAGVQAGVE